MSRLAPGRADPHPPEEHREFSPRGAGVAERAAAPHWLHAIHSGSNDTRVDTYGVDTYGVDPDGVEPDPVEPPEEAP